jgi:hypothetical protein
VLRDEIYKAIRDENQAAATTHQQKRRMEDAFKRLRSRAQERGSK